MTNVRTRAAPIATTAIGHTSTHDSTCGGDTRRRGTDRTLDPPADATPLLFRRAARTSSPGHPPATGPSSVQAPRQKSNNARPEMIEWPRPRAF